MRWTVLALSALAVMVDAPLHAQSVNLALGKPVARSSDVSAGRAVNLVDGSVDTFWQPLMADRQDDRMVWARIDLGVPVRADKIVLKFRTSTSFVDGYRVLASNDDATWQQAFAKARPADDIASTDTAVFAAVTFRYIRVEFTLNDPVRNFQLNELELYDTGGVPPPATLTDVFLVEAIAGGGSGRTFAPAETVNLAPPQQLALRLKGHLNNGQETTLDDAIVTFASSKPAAASIEAPSGATATVAALTAGVAQITATAALGASVRSTTLWIVVVDATALVADLRVMHPTMAAEIGKPAVVRPGEAYPALEVRPYVNLVLTGALERRDLGQPDEAPGEIVRTLPWSTLTAGVPRTFTLAGTADRPGSYRLRLSMRESGKPAVYDGITFTVLDPAHVPAGQSAIAFVGSTGTLAYVPDFKGNRVLDFSNAGYMGGGVALPDVPARIAVAPADGDDSARIQAAIDAVSRMPQNAEGIRGAVLLTRGTFEVGTTLTMRASGVVLRGEGRGEDGTILFATGTAKRNVLEIGGTAGRLLLPARSPIADLYVPSGARSFRVDDPSLFKVGDQVLVRRVGNDRWIHEIAMDQIVERPGSPDATDQWTPFNLDFDRVITRIMGTIVTVDAPIANAIERRWGGGELIAYDDPDRIEHVGVENLRVVVEFDPSVTAVNDGVTYFADENHARVFAALDSVKHAWVREVTALHLEHALSNVLRNAKWVTVQDSAAIEMVSLITGERRYNFKLAGQLALVQRNHAETARHAFVVDSRVPGPNVFLDGDSIDEFATSEPHHRWSVGGLYDNIHADIAMQDRAWLGSGHGWAGANYVAWNTEGDLVAQQPPTAQNYAIGHVGPKVPGFVPNGDDPRPRKDGYWELLGQHAAPRSLYLQQLEDRLGADAVTRIERTPVGGGALDTPTVPAPGDLPLAQGITVNGESLAGFSSTTFDYVATLPAGTTTVPAVTVTPADQPDLVEMRPASHVNGNTIVILRDDQDQSRAVRYTIRFVTAP